MFQFASFASASYFFRCRYYASSIVGCPIRKSPAQRLLTTCRGLSQSTTSFIASKRQNIHHIPLISYISIFLFTSFLSLLYLSKIGVQDFNLPFSILTRRSSLELFTSPHRFLFYFTIMAKKKERVRERTLSVLSVLGPDDHFSFLVIPRKEVIQPQVPLRLPCYDLVPVMEASLGASLSEELSQRLQATPTSVA